MDKRTLVAGLLWDVGLPVVVFCACRAFDMAALLALAAGGVAALVRVGWVAFLRRRLAGLAAIVSVSFVLLLVVSLLTGDARVLLARESILTGAAGLVLLGSCVLGKPVLFLLVRRLNAGKEDALARLDERWRTVPSFRRQFFGLSAVFGGVFLAESILRVVLIYLLPIDAMAVVSPALQLGTVAVVVLWALWYRGRRQRAAAAGDDRTRVGQRERSHVR